MSISDIQKRRVINEIIQRLFSKGVKPEVLDLSSATSEFFSRNPIGSPYALDRGLVGPSQITDPKRMNEAFDTMLENVLVLYLAYQDQIGRLLDFGRFSRSKFDQIQDRRQDLLNRMEDYLFSTFNADGYYYSYSDNFRTVSFVDLDLSTAFVNTETSQVGIPINSTLSRMLTANDLSLGSVKVYNDETEEELTYDSRVGLASGMFDGLSNTFWAIEVVSNVEIDVRADIEVGVLNRNGQKFSKVGVVPYGITEAQYWLEAKGVDADNYTQFGSKIVTTVLPTSFDDGSKDYSSVLIHVRKSEPDYVKQTLSGETEYRYIIGFKDVSVAAWAYDNHAKLITNPIKLPRDIGADNQINAVSLTVKDSQYAGSSIQYYVAADNEDVVSPTIDSFEWRKINPVRDGNTENSSVSFGGNLKSSKFIRRDPVGSEILVSALDDSNPDLMKRNPSSVIVENSSVYRLGSFATTFVPGTLSLEEGVDTARVLVRPYDSTMLDTGLSYWTDYVKGIKTPSDEIYRDIRRGNDFFYGGSIGSAGKSVYVETYLDSPESYEDQIREIVKDERNVRQWGIKVYVNGLEVSDLPIGTDSRPAKFNFKQGLNHIAMLISIPANTQTYPNVYIGSIRLMGRGNLQDYGTVRLGTLKHVDYFDFKYNYSEESDIFTINDNVLYMYKKPLDNYRIQYVASSDDGPKSVRLRADFNRDKADHYVSPHLDQYRIRFAY